VVTWLSALAKTRRNIIGALGRVFSRAGGADGDLIEELEATLLKADVPVRLVAQLIGELEQSDRNLKLAPRDRLQRILVDALAVDTAFAWGWAVAPQVILVVGVNGSGKTTTCAKLAHQARLAGLDPLLGATDTFRAAGADQLKWWGDSLDCDVVAGAAGADAAAVAYDALDAAIARRKDVLIVDTAGRMHTRQPLMQELQKVRGALAKRLPGAPAETWIVLDATLGQNAVVQARMFHEVTPLSGVIVSKLDGSARAGFVFAISKELRIPIRFAGLGEGREDLVPFEPREFVAALTAENPAPGTPA